MVHGLPGPLRARPRGAGAAQSHRPGRPGQDAVDLQPAAGRDRQGADPGLPHPHPRRADGGAHRSRGARAVRHHAQTRRARNLDHLHIAPAGGDFRELRPRHGLARRPAHRDAGRGGDHPGLHRQQHGRPRDRQALPAEAARRGATAGDADGGSRPDRRTPLPRRRLLAEQGRDPRHRRPDRRRAKRDRQGHLRAARGHERRGHSRRRAAC